jgi:hypothetical protein
VTHAKPPAGMENQNAPPKHSKLPPVEKSEDLYKGLILEEPVVAARATSTATATAIGAKLSVQGQVKFEEMVPSTNEVPPPPPAKKKSEVSVDRTAPIPFVDVLPSSKSKSHAAENQKIMEISRQNPVLDQATQNRIVAGLARQSMKNAAFTQNQQIMRDSKLPQEPSVTTVKAGLRGVVDAAKSSSSLGGVQFVDVVSKDDTSRTHVTGSGRQQNQILSLGNKDEKEKLASQALENQKIIEAARNNGLSITDIVNALSNVIPGSRFRQSSSKPSLKMPSATSVESAAPKEKQQIAFVDLTPESKSTGPTSLKQSVANIAPESAVKQKQSVAFVDIVSKVEGSQSQAKVTAKSVVKEAVNFVDMVTSDTKQERKPVGTGFRSRRLASSKSKNSKRPTRSPSHLSAGEKAALDLIDNSIGNVKPGDSVTATVKNEDSNEDDVSSEDDKVGKGEIENKDDDKSEKDDDESEEDDDKAEKDEEKEDGDLEILDVSKETDSEPPPPSSSKGSGLVPDSVVESSDKANPPIGKIIVIVIKI